MSPCACVLSFYPSTSSTTSVRADPSTLLIEETHALWSHTSPAFVHVDLAHVAAHYGGEIFCSWCTGTTTINITVVVLVPVLVLWFHCPFHGKTAVPFWGHTSQNVSTLSPKPDCSPIIPFRTGVPILGTIHRNFKQFVPKMGLRF